MTSDPSTDVFICHHPVDTYAAKSIAAQLAANGLDVGPLLPTSLNGELSDEILHSIAQSRVLVVLIGDEFIRDEDEEQLLSLMHATAAFRDPGGDQRRFVPVRVSEVDLPTALRHYSAIDYEPYAARWLDRLIIACRTSDRSATQITEPVINSTAAVAHSDRIGCVDITDDGQIIATGGDDRRIVVTSRTGSSRPIAIPAHKHFLTGLAISADGLKCVTASYDGTIKLWCLQTQVAETHKIMPDGDPVVRLACTPDLAIAACRTEPVDALDQYFSDDDYQRPSAFDEEREQSPWGSSVTVVDLKAGDVLCYVELPQSASKAIAITADATMLAVAQPLGSILLFDVRSSLPVAAPLSGHTGRITELAFSSDKKRLYSAGDDLTIRVWDVENRQCLSILEGFTARPIGLSVTADGTRLCACSRDGQILSWDSASFRKVYDTHDGGDEADGRHSACFSNDGDVVVTASDAGIVRSVELSQSGQLFNEVSYTNAKVVLVGDTGVGKSGLAEALSTGEFKNTVSSDAHWATRLHLDSGELTSDREIWLWDFAGQYDYRLIHQLFMDETSLALLVYNPQSDSPFEGLAQWDSDLSRASRRAFNKILVAGRCDRGGLTVSQELVDSFIAEKQFTAFVRTSALTGEGCDELKRLIVSSIDWDAIPWTASSRVFKSLKDEILKLRDNGVTLIRLSELRQRIEMQLIATSLELEEPVLSFSTDELEAVVGLLAGPGLIWRLQFADFVLLRPEVLNSYASAVIRSVRSHRDEIGVIAEDKVLAGDLKYEDMKRLRAEDEEIVLRAMHQLLVDKGICLREATEEGVFLVFPSYFRRERPDLEGHPAIHVTYRFSGSLDEVYSTLVVRLHYSRFAESQVLWRYAVDYKTSAGQHVGLKLRKLGEGIGELDVYLEGEVSLDARVLFMKYVHEHLLSRASDVVRYRRFVCPHCGHGVRDDELVRATLEEEGATARLRCQRSKCDKWINLWDEVEQKFASPEFVKLVRKVEQKTRAAIDNESLDLILQGNAKVTAATAGQIYRDLPSSDHGIDGEIEFKTRGGRASGQRAYVQLKHGDSYIYKRKRDRSEVFYITKPHWASYWRSQAYPVMLVIKTSEHGIRWMDVSAYLSEHFRVHGKEATSIVFQGEPFNELSVRRMRDRVVGD